ncbi:MAG: cupin domain-containing protein [Rhizomicrobium sp.]
MKTRPSFIKNWRETEYSGVPNAADVDHAAAFSNLSEETGLSRLGVGHLRLPPGARTGPPAAMRDEEEFVFVLQGTPDLWADGYLFRLKEGDGAALHAKTGMANAFLNNSDEDVHLFMFKEGSRFTTKYFFPTDPVATSRADGLRKLWKDAPRRRLGPHDGLTDLKRRRPSPEGSRKARKPDFVVHWRDILEKKAAHYPNSTEEQGIDAKFGKRARFSRIGIHLEILKPGRRTSYPHAERDEEEFVYVVSGAVDCWLDGHIHPMGEGDFVGWEGGTGITHVIMNNGNEDAILLVGGEASRWNGQCWYPYHPSRKNEMGANYWTDHPVPKLGPHDGLPDALRERVPPKARKSALAANTAAPNLKPPPNNKRK